MTSLHFEHNQDDEEFLQASRFVFAPHPIFDAISLTPRTMVLSPAAIEAIAAGLPIDCFGEPADPEKFGVIVLRSKFDTMPPVG